jgi:hypothetical protein
MLDEAQLEALRVKYGRVGTVDWTGHQLVFRRPSRDEVREYRRKEDSPREKPDRVDQLAQATIVAFDGRDDILQARTMFLAFLDEYPFFCDSPKLQTVITVLAGGIEEEASSILGKGCSVRSAAQKNSPPVSVPGAVGN